MTDKYSSNGFRNIIEREKITRFADNFKMFVVGVLIISVIFFGVIGDEAAKGYMRDWAVLMVTLVIICIILDVINWRKIKKAGL